MPKHENWDSTTQSLPLHLFFFFCLLVQLIYFGDLYNNQCGYIYKFYFVFILFSEDIYYGCECMPLWVKNEGEKNQLLLFTLKLFQLSRNYFLPVSVREESKNTQTNLLQLKQKKIYLLFYSLIFTLFFLIFISFTLSSPSHKFLIPWYSECSQVSNGDTCHRSFYPNIMRLYTFKSNN